MRTENEVELSEYKAAFAPIFRNIRGLHYRAATQNFLGITTVWNPYTNTMYHHLSVPCFGNKKDRVSAKSKAKLFTSMIADAIYQMSGQFGISVDSLLAEIGFKTVNGKEEEVNGKDDSGVA